MEERERCYSFILSRTPHETIITVEIISKPFCLFSEAFEMTMKVFNRLDIVINNAGVMNDRFWELEVDVNLVSSPPSIIIINFHTHTN
jgi:15-hydroxyprostaglandin dehydrogenase (NAD)